MAKLKVRGQSGLVTLSDQDFVSSGGEGSVYAKNKVAYKIYHKPQDALQSGIPAKINLLEKIRHPYLATPTGVLLDEGGNFIGVESAFIDGTALMRVFSDSWRVPNGFGAKESANLVSKMREALLTVHAHQALVVDGNEMNYLVDKTLNPVLIDTDSWKIGSFAGTVMMPSIKDYHSTLPSVDSDWFAWAIVTFQVFTGIHPFKGTHSLFKKGDLEARMKACVSIFESAVSVPANVRDISNIPNRLRDWYEAMFKTTMRSIPPEDFGSAGKPLQGNVVYQASGSLRLTKIGDFPDNIVKIAGRFVITHNRQSTFSTYTIWDATSKKELLGVNGGMSDFTVLVVNNKPFLIKLNTSGLVEYGEIDFQKGLIGVKTLPLRGIKVEILQGVPYVVAEDSWQELQINQIGSGIVLTVRNTYKFNQLSTVFYDTCAILKALGGLFVAIKTSRGLEIKKLPSKLKVAEVFWSTLNKLVVTGYDIQGQINQEEYKLSSSGNLEIKSTRQQSQSELNYVEIPGIMLGMQESDEIEVTTLSKQMKFKGMQGLSGIKLAVMDQKLVGFKDNTLWRIENKA